MEESDQQNVDTFFTSIGRRIGKSLSADAGKSNKEMGMPDSVHIFYINMKGRSLIDAVEELQEIIAANNIELVIIDSVMAAMGGGNNRYSDVNTQAQEFFNAVGSLGCASLLIDHDDKASIKMATLTVWLPEQSASTTGAVLCSN